MSAKQLGLPYAKGSRTSKDAAASVVARAPTMRNTILGLIAERSFGLTGDEIEVLTGFPHQTVGPRLLELREERRIGDSGTTRQTRSGRFAVVWVLTP